MVPDMEILRAEGMVRRAVAAAAAMAALGALAVAAATLWPLRPESPSAQATPMETSASTMPARQGLAEILEKLSARRNPLIAPPQVQAAVKDSGAAAKLAKKLKLQGIVAMGDQYVAYIQAEDNAVRTVRKGETLLDFTVADITAASVTLSLEGVEVVLGH